MSPPTFSGRSLGLLLLLCGLFTGFYVTGDLIGAKLFSFTVFGLAPRDLGLGTGDVFIMTAGTLAFPLTFLLTDIVNEYYGRSVVRALTIVAITVLLVLQPVVVATVAVPTVSFNPAVSAEQMEASVRNVLAPAWAIVVGSIAAFALGQWLDVLLFARLRRLTGSRALWLRAQASTFGSQLVDSFVVIFVAFVLIPAALGQDPWPLGNATQVSTTNYVVKVGIAIASTPLLYLVHLGVVAWLGRSEATRLQGQAHG